VGDKTRERELAHLVVKHETHPELALLTSKYWLGQGGKIRSLGCDIGMTSIDRCAKELHTWWVRASMIHRENEREVMHVGLTGVSPRVGFVDR
jgi:hypothetical protein